MDLQALFEGLSIAAIEGFVQNRQDEHLSLDFKTAGAAMTSGADKKNLAELLSGFSNSAGGIVIWGVATRKDVAGRDVATELKPISDVERFVMRLKEHTPLLLSPPNVGVRHRAFVDSRGEGFAATLVPESSVGPHMALGGHDRYFKRAGDRFYRMEHFDIADMFGRRQRASLQVVHTLSGWPSLYGQEGTKRTAQLTIRLANNGRASVPAPFVRLEASEPYEVKRYGASSRQHGEAQFEVVPEASRIISLVAGANILLHPKMSIPIAEVVAEFWDHEIVRGCTVQFAHAAMDLPLVEGTLNVTAIQIAEALGRKAGVRTTIKPE